MRLSEDRTFASPDGFENVVGQSEVRKKRSPGELR
jgi:hypothetical protein